MGKTKDQILNTALNLFNEQGVADVSIRQIASAMGISHGNLIYHFKHKSEIIQALHEALLTRAIQINERIDREDFDLLHLYKTTLRGFAAVYEYRFFFYDLLYIANNDPLLGKTLREVEKLRAQMYREVIALSIQRGLMLPEAYSGQYEDLITWIRIYSDHWLSSAAMYDSESAEVIIEKYARLLVKQFYGYLTPVGQAALAKAGLIPQESQP
ncbi:MAG: TetR/AcrR family transcriptional regulator [Bacteroidota bacterium]